MIRPPITSGRVADVGPAGEDAALAAYRRAGYRLIARNWSCRVGELDLVMARGETLVFCEVKARRGVRFGAGYESVTARKRAKVRSVAEAFLLSSRLEPGAVRFDVASVLVRERPQGGEAGSDVELFEDAF